MSPRNKVPALLILTGLLLITALVSPVQAQEKNQKKNIFINFYQDHISAADGSRCPMTPSCSEYAAQAVKKHGPVTGWIMACDRLMRCGRDEARLSPTVWINNHGSVSDPVSANDFWWFNKKEKEPESE